MKKTTLLMLLAFSPALIFAKGWKSSENVGSLSKTSVKSLNRASNSMRLAPQSNQTTAAFYTEDFSGGVIPANWSNADGTGSGMVWVFTSLGSANQPDSLSATGTTAANGYVKFDSDSSGASIGGEDGILTTAAINCTGRAAVRFSCNEFFRQYAASSAVISVSNDSVTWTEIHHAETGLIQDQGTPNPNLVDVDISATAGNQATVYIRFEYIGDYDYYWFIDDVTLFEPSQVDAGVAAVSATFNGCSLSSTEPISVLVQNFGVDPISNFDVSYMVNLGTPVTETFTGVLNSGDTVTYTFAQTADLSAALVYQIDAYTGQIGDGNNANDSALAVTESYSHIDLTVGPYDMGFEPTDDFTAYTIEDLDADGTTFDISSAYVNSGTQCLRKPGSGVDDDNWLFTQCLDIVSGGTYTLSYYYKNFELLNPCSLEVYMGTSNTYTTMTNLVIQNPIPGDTTYQFATAALSAAPGTYYLGFHFYSGQGTGTSSLRLDDIHIDFDNAVIENQVASAISVYPNPSNGKISISNRNINEKNFALKVYNSLGAVVLTNQFNDLSNEQIDLSNQPAGVYSVQLKSATTTVNKSIVISAK